VADPQILDRANLDTANFELDESILSNVEIQVQKIEKRQRQIEAKIQLPYPVEQVWQVLTDYEALSEFIPNLEMSQRVEHPDGGIRVEQIGAQTALKMKFSARVVLDMEENFPESLNFDMVEGDFNEFEGQWCLSCCNQSNQPQTELTYRIKVWPKRTMPIVVVENRLAKDLPINLLAIRERLDTLYGLASSSAAIA
jgi:ribosome-associated toxin RatA of RatAB toxin-antitoxin module